MPVALATLASFQLTGTEAFLRSLAGLVLIAVNAFFVTAEFSIVSVRRSRINQLASAGDVQAKTVQDLHQSISRLLSATQIGITLSSLALGWISQSTVSLLVVHGLAQLPLGESMRETIARFVAIPLTFFFIAYLQIVLGELCPKSIALLYPEQLSRFLGPPSLTIARLLNPAIWVLNQSTNLLLKLGGIRDTGQGWYEQVSPEELQMMISTSSVSTGLEAEARELLNNVFEFSEVAVWAVMVPRTEINAIDSDATFQMLLHQVAHAGYSRYPVIGDSIDDIEGMIYFKEIAEPLALGTISMDTPLKPWIRPAQFVPEQMTLGELLPLMQRTRQPMVIVVDEFGGTAGLVTLEDLIAEIIGDHNEPETAEEVDLQMLEDGTYLVQAQLDIESVNEALNLKFPLTEEYQTLGGFLLYLFQKVPAAGETLHYENLELTVVSTDGPRLHQIQIQRLEPPAPDPASTQSAIGEE